MSDDDQRESKGIWSKEPPSAPGFYWCRQYGRTRMVSVWKYPSANDERLFTNEDGGAQLDDRELYGGAMWNGPIQPPVYA